MLANQAPTYERAYGLMRQLNEDDIQKALSYMEFLRLREEEDLNDLRYIEAHRNEPSIPLEQALLEIGVE